MNHGSTLEREMNHVQARRRGWNRPVRLLFSFTSPRPPISTNPDLYQAKHLLRLARIPIRTMN